MQTDQMQQIDDPQIIELAGKLYLAKFFIYLVNFAHAAAGVISQSLTIDSDADFQLLYLIASRTSALDTVEIFEGSAGGLAWQSGPVNIDNLAGTAQLPFPIGLVPQLLPKKRVYNIRSTNTFAGANPVQLCFTGYKLYPAEQIASLGAQPSQ
jgi:hypothetical protein